MADNLPVKQKIGEEEIKKANEVLHKYWEGKKQLETKIVENEEFWKLRHWESTNKKVPATGWLWNALVAKHADMMDAYPEPSFLARALDDEEEAKRLSSIVPVIFDQNNFRDIFSDCAFYKLKQGASCFGVFWDPKKFGGFGDIAIKEIDLLNIFWQPGISDIQQSRHLFHVELIDNELLEMRYPQLEGKLDGASVMTTKYLYDDNIDTSDKSSVVDWYYHTEYDGHRVLHYCKFVNNEVLFASENEPKRYPNGFYNHGMYPFVIDPLYKIKGSICGYSLVDIAKDTQVQIDLLSDAMIKNARHAAKNRYFVREDGDVNEEEFANLDNDFVHTTTGLGEESIRKIETHSISGNYISILDNKINEMKEVLGNHDVSNGIPQGGATAASAIAALQESSGKGSRDIISTTYSSFKKITTLVIEYIRQFYNTERQFRIVGADGKPEYLKYKNSGLVPQKQPDVMGVKTGMRLPCFDIEVSAEKANSYNKLSQNELALQFYGLGFFDPQNSDKAMACLSVMDFATKNKMLDIIKKNGSMYDKLMQFATLAFELAAKYEPRTAARLQSAIAQMGIATSSIAGDFNFKPNTAESPAMTKARARAAEATQPR